ncbi:hypothetical protein K3495_g5684 [Podosphaera aphanis]|nr:hypothetical protein K3495_g5684 [Podosphaera aphanis]
MTQKKGLTGSWEKLKELRRKLVSADKTLKNLYPDRSLFLIFTRSLPSEYKATKDGLRLHKDIKEDEKAHAAFRKKTSKYLPPHRRDTPRHDPMDLDSESASNQGGAATKFSCYLCYGGHYMRECTRLKLARTLLDRYDKQKQNKRKLKPFSQKKNSQKQLPQPKIEKSRRKKNHGFTATTDSDSSLNLLTSYNNESAESNSDIEIYRVSNEIISMTTPSIWATDTAASSHISDQKHLFRQLVPIRRRTIMVGGGKLYAELIGTIEITCDDGLIERFKARLVARGFSQVQGQDYTETFAPTVRMDTLRLFFAIIAAENLECSYYNIKNAFMESHLKEEIYLNAPPGITNGLILLVYFDDILAAALKVSHLEWFFEKLSSRYKAKDLGGVDRVLGIRITRDREKRTVYLDQEQYLTGVLERFGITNAQHKKKKIPATDYESLRPASKQDTRINVTEYKQAIGSLMYAMVLTRPDIAFVLGKLSQYMSDPAQHHGSAPKNLMRYLKATVSQKLRYGPGRGTQFGVYSDADWASDKADRKSVSWGVVMFYGGPISWLSSKQRSVATSSSESEYIALSTSAKQGHWVAQVFRDLKRSGHLGKNPDRVQMYSDNQVSLALVKNPHLHERSKHIDVCFHYIRDMAEKGKLIVEYIPTSEMIADGMTKPLARINFEKLKIQLGLVS